VGAAARSVASLYLPASLHTLSATNAPSQTPTPTPPGAGKTNVAVLCILHQLGLHRGQDGEIDKSAFKIVYIAPMKVKRVIGVGAGGCGFGFGAGCGAGGVFWMLDRECVRFLVGERSLL